MERIEEYNSLRQEILQRDAKYNEYLQIACAVTTAVLTFALGQKEPMVCIVPIVMIVPLYRLGLEQLNQELKIGMYLYVFYSDEGLLWEKRHKTYYRVEKNIIEENKTKGRNGTTIERDPNHWLYIVLILICALLSFYKMFDVGYSANGLTVRLFIVVLVTTMSILLVLIFRKKYSYGRGKLFIEIWEQIKKEENNKKQHEEQPGVS